MRDDREGILLDKIQKAKGTQEIKWVIELLSIRRERHRDRLESEENQEVRGKAKECKELIKKLTE